MKTIETDVFKNIGKTSGAFNTFALTFPFNLVIHHSGLNIHHYGPSSSLNIGGLRGGTGSHSRSCTVPSCSS